MWTCVPDKPAHSLFAAKGTVRYVCFTLTVYPAATTVSIQSATYGTLDNRTISVSLTEELQLTAVVYPWLDGELGAITRQ